MTRHLKKTERLPPQDARARAVGRNTDLMGLPPEAPEPTFRDTQRTGGPEVEALLPAGVDPRILDGQAAADRAREFASQSQNQPGIVALQQLQPAQEKPRGRGGPRNTHPLSDKAAAAEFVLPQAKRPRDEGAPKIDISAADPRRAKTARIARRPEEYLDKDWSVSREPQPDAPAQSGSFWTVALVGLTLLAVLLGGALAYTQLVLRK